MFIFTLDNKEEERDRAAGHKEAFMVVKDFVIKNILNGGQIFKLLTLRDLYTEKLSETRFKNSNYQAKKLKVNKI